MQTHRKQVKHFNEPGHLHELTFSCYQRQQLLNDDERRLQVCESIDRAMKRHRYDLLAFVIMPEHVHLIVSPGGGASDIDDLLKAIKRPSSYRIKKLYEQSGECYEHLIVRQRPGTMTFRFWQEGPGYDRNLMQSGTIMAAIEYVHLNPVRRGLCNACTDWLWSSARDYLTPDMPRLAGLPAIHFPVDVLQ